MSQVCTTTYLSRSIIIPFNFKYLAMNCDHVYIVKCSQTLTPFSCLQTDQDKENFQKLIKAIKESKSVSMCRLLQ